MIKADKAIWGPPGTGKTTRLLEILMKKIEETDKTIQDVAVSTFRKALAGEATEKIKSEMGLSELPEESYIGTTHAICLQLLREEGYDYGVVNPEDRKEFCEEFGVEYQEEKKQKGMADVQRFNGNVRGNALFQIYSYEVNNPEKRWTEGPVTEDMLSRINDYLVEDFSEAWERYKSENGFIDYDDMLQMVLDHELFPFADFLFEDEFQDKTPLQYEIYKMWAEYIPEVYIAGDSLQAIYTYLGTDPSFFRTEWEKAEEQEIRPESYRFSKELWEYVRKIPESVGIEVPEVEGHVDYETSFQYIDMNDFRRKVTNFRNDSVLYLLRANFMKNDIIRILKDRGIPYVVGFGEIPKITKLYNAVAYARKKLDFENRFVTTTVNLKGRSAYQLLSSYPAKMFDCTKKTWKQKAKDKEWVDLPVTPAFTTKIFQDNPFTDLLAGSNTDHKKRKQLNELIHRRNGRPINPDKRHIISTIHGSKGREADYVFLFADRTRRIQKESDPKSEARVFFVGATRAKKKLFIVDGPNRQFQYNFP